ncbi:hypothetical protein ACFLYJ_01620 [Candidatus Cloacimonadota bacterium]
MFNNKSNNLLFGLFVVFQIVFAGFIIGIFHRNHFWVAAFLLISIIIYYIKSVYFQKTAKKKITLTFLGMLISMLMGTAAEYWGTSYGHWEYHDVASNIQIPFWVPLAWALAYKTIHKFETVIINNYNLNKLQKFLFIIITPAIILPVIGEIVVINLGTWSYSWQPQILGIPWQAAVLLGFFHSCMFYLMKIIYKKTEVDDPVYNPY